MANYSTVRDLKLGALSKSGEITTGSSDYDSTSLEEMNLAYRALMSSANEFEKEFGVNIDKPFDWAKSYDPGIIKLIAPYETGTISLTNGSASGTLSDAPGAGLGSFKNWTLKIEDRPEFFRIKTHAAESTSITLDGDYTDSTGGALTYKIIKLDYDLTPGIIRLITPMRVFRLQPSREDRFGEITAMDLKAFQKRYPTIDLFENTPTRFTIVQRESGGKYRIRFNAYVANDTRLEYDWIPIPEKLQIQTIATSQVDTSNNDFDITSHGFLANDIVQIETTNALPSGLSLETDYYIVRVDADNFGLSATRDGSTIALATVGTGTHYVSNVPRIPIEHRTFLMYLVAHFILLDKDDSRTDYYFRQTQQKLQALSLSQVREIKQISKDFGRLVTRQDNRGDRTKGFLPENYV